MILASAYVLCHFLSSRPIYWVEWCEVGSGQIGQAASPDERFVPKDQSDADSADAELRRVMAKDNTIIQIQIVAIVQVFL